MGLDFGTIGSRGSLSCMDILVGNGLFSLVMCVRSANMLLDRLIEDVTIEATAVSIFLSVKVIHSKLGREQRGS